MARECATVVAQEAAHVIGDTVRGMEVREKGPSDLITAADEASQDHIIGRLRALFPGCGILAEEDGAEIASGEFCWVIDPLDGTTNFAHGLSPYAVSIALRRKEAVLVGVVLDVKTGDVFSAQRGAGAFCNGERMAVSRRGSLAESLIATGFPYRSFDYERQYLDSLHRCMVATRGVRRLGSASIDLAYVACGIFDGFFEIDLRPWDVAAGLLLVEEAYGRVTDFDGNPDPLSGRQILATNGLIHHEMLHITEPLRESMTLAAETLKACPFPPISC